MSISVFAKQVLPESTVKWVSLIFCQICAVLTIYFMHDINYIFNLKLIILIDYLITKSKVVTEKSQTEALLY